MFWSNEDTSQFIFRKPYSWATLQSNKLIQKNNFSEQTRLLQFYCKLSVYGKKYDIKMKSIALFYESNTCNNSNKKCSRFNLWKIYQFKWNLDNRPHLYARSTNYSCTPFRLSIHVKNILDKGAYLSNPTGV